MAVTGWKTVTSAATESFSSWSDLDWTNPSNITTTGEASITSPQYDSPKKSYILKGYNCGFDTTDVPVGSKIVGIEIKANARYAVAAVNVDFISPLDENGSRAGSNQASTPTALTTTATDYTWGGSTNLCGYTTITDTVVRSTGFGAAFGAAAAGSNSDVFVDYLQVRVYYEPPVEKSVTESTITIAEAVFILIPTLFLSVAEPTITIAEVANAYPPIVYIAPAADTITINEVANAEKQEVPGEDVNLPTVTDTILVSESAYVAPKACIYINEQVWIDVITPLPESIDLPAVSDSITIAESVTAHIPELFISATEPTITVAEQVTRLVPELKIPITDPTITIAEQVTILRPELHISAAESINVVEQEPTVQPQLQGEINLPAVSEDRITIAEVASILIPELFVDVSEDRITVAELASISASSAITMHDVATISESVWIDVINRISVADTILVSDIATLGGEVLITSPADTITIAEVATIHVPELFVAATEDRITLSESVTILRPSLFITATEPTITIADQATVFAGTIPLPTVQDSITIAESASIHITQKFVSAADQINVAEQATIHIPVLYISASDAITISESVTIYAPLVIVSASESLTISESAEIHIPTISKAVTDSTITVAESANIEIPTIVDVFVTPAMEGILISEAVTIAVTPLFINVADAITLHEGYANVWPSNNWYFVDVEVMII